MYFFIGAKKQTRRLASRALHANCASLLVGKDRSARARQSPIESAALEVHDCAVGSVLACIMHCRLADVAQTADFA
jgi:hypothetical protein